MTRPGLGRRLATPAAIALEHGLSPFVVRELVHVAHVAHGWAGGVPWVDRKAFTFCAGLAGSGRRDSAGVSGNPTPAGQFISQTGYGKKWGEPDTTPDRPVNLPCSNKEFTRDP